MKNCKRCGFVPRPGARFCGRCGDGLRPKLSQQAKKTTTQWTKLSKTALTVFITLLALGAVYLWVMVIDGIGLLFLLWSFSDYEGDSSYSVGRQANPGYGRGQNYARHFVCKF